MVLHCLNISIEHSADFSPNISSVSSSEEDVGTTIEKIPKIGGLQRTRTPLAVFITTYPLNNDSSAGSFSWFEIEPHVVDVVQRPTLRPPSILVDDNELPREIELVVLNFLAYLS